MRKKEAEHGDFHNIAFLLLFATAAVLVLRLEGMRFGEWFLFAVIGFAVHIFEVRGCSILDIAICGRRKRRDGVSG